MQNLLKSYPSVVEIPVAWGEMDAFQHVNNVVYIRYFETGRIAYFEKCDLMGFMERTGVGPILASVQCKFKAPVTYPDTVSVGVKVVGVQEDRFVVHHRVVSHKLGRTAAEGEGVIVSYDYRANRKTALPDEMKQCILGLESLVSD